ncbi:MAG: hypothetical protein LBO76_03665 [Treponema sp.]|jgi:hypothetical protein|nr:hypothetical protein [Treponema sp.]
MISGRSARVFALALFLTLPPALCPAPLGAEPYSPYAGVLIDLPPGYQERRTQGAAQRSFANGQGAVFEMELSGEGGDPAARLERARAGLGIPAGEPGGIESYDSHGLRAALARIEFVLDGAGRPLARGGGAGGARAYQGWALCVDRGEDQLLALAYGPAGNTGLELLSLSCLDSIAPTGAERYYWGPVTEFAWPRGETAETRLYNTALSARIAGGDAEAAQGLVDREFQVLRLFEGGPRWQEAWRRFYRMIRRDSWERLADALFQLERSWNAEAVLGGTRSVPGPDAAGGSAGGIAAGLDDYALAARALSYVQGFRYERDLIGSDVVNLGSAITEGRGDCDSRAMLWALFLAQANIPAGIMVSREYGHAMGIADLEGPGARLPLGDRQYLVAETTAAVGLGLIGRNVSEAAKWLGVMFE